MLRSVMVPAEFSEECSLIMRFAAGLGSMGVRRVVVGHVLDSSGMEGPVIAMKVDKARDDVRALAKPLTDAGLDVEVRIGTGDTVHGLLGIASEAHVGAVICGTHGKGRLSKLLSRSVSEQIAVEANIPTMLIRYDLLRLREDPADYARSFGRSLVVPTDFSASAMRALMAVLELPAKGIGTVYLTHVLDRSLSGTKLRKAEDGAEFQLGNQRSIAENQSISARGVIKHGEPVQMILAEANERRATGIVVGTRGQNLLQEAVLGSTSMTLIRQASCPVMIVP